MPIGHETHVQEFCKPDAEAVQCRCGTREDSHDNKASGRCGVSRRCGPNVKGLLTPDHPYSNNFDQRNLNAWCVSDWVQSMLPIPVRPLAWLVKGAMLSKETPHACGASIHAHSIAGVTTPLISSGGLFRVPRHPQSAQYACVPTE